MLTDSLNKLEEFSNKLAGSGCMKCSARSPTRLCIPRSIVIPGKVFIEPSMLILSHPRESDEITGRVLSGAEKKTLNKWLSYITHGPIYVTTAVKCRSEEDREPKKQEINICASTLLKYEIAQLNPRVIILLGKVAIKAIFNCPDKEASEMLLSKKPYKINGTNGVSWNGDVYSCYHPAYFEMGAGERTIEETLCIDILKQSLEGNYE